jgi:putative ABC transport system permease protein
VTILSNLLSIFRIAAKRLWSHKALSLSLLLGWTVAVGLGLSVPLYAEAVNYQLLRAELKTTREGTSPFAFLFRYIGSWHGAKEWSEVESADDYLRGPVADDIGLPVASVIRYFKTDNFRLFPTSEIVYADVRDPLDWVGLGFVSDLAGQITLVEGDFPASSNASESDGPLEVLLYRQLADELGLQAGEDYSLIGRRDANKEDTALVQIPVHIAGVWEPTNPQDPYWFFDPINFKNLFLVPEASFRATVAPTLVGEVYQAVWYLLLDGSSVRTEHVESLLEQIRYAQSRAEAFLSDTRLDVSPAEAMRTYRVEAQLLTILLSVFAVPVMGLILFFVALTASMAVSRQRTEIAVLRSRGTSRWQILGVYLLEGLVLAAGALGLGIYLGQAIALGMGQVRSFLTVVAQPSLPIHLSWQNLRFAIGAVVLVLLTTLLPALSAAGHTIITHKQEQARSLRRPSWQRYFVDVLLLVVALYGYHVLRGRGTISLYLESGSASNPFENPLLFLVPTFFIFALGLFFIRFFPLLMSVLAWLAGRLRGTPSVLAFRHLARSSRDYVGPLLLLILTLGIASFASSMALTLDGHLVDRVYYQFGSDVRLNETGESTELFAGTVQGMASEEGAEEEEAGPRWLFLPVSQHLDVQGVLAAARVGKYTTYYAPAGRETGTFTGVDRVDFPAVAFYRADFASHSMGGLMNLLAFSPDSLLVDQAFLERHGVRVGDPLRLILSLGGEQKEVDFQIAGTLDLFPTLFPEDGSFFVGNLDYAFQQVGDEYPYNVWLATDGTRTAEDVVTDLGRIGFTIVDYDDSREIILAEQTRPERQGLFGVLSVGFLAAAGLTVLGFLLYAVFSFRQRFIELGVLRAIGLTVGQMVAFLTGEQLTLILTGAVVGTALGVSASHLFVPFLQVRSGPHPHTPPFVVQIAWSDIDRIYLVFGGMLLVGVVAMTIMLVRMRVFEAVKLGEVA